MSLSIGVNLRVTGHCNQGGRKYMEDMFSVAYQQSSNDRELEYAFFGIFDGHGGGEAATFAKENLMDIIVKQKNFWSDNDEDVLKAIRDGYVNTHYAMWRELDKWPRTASGLPSTAGTTASIAFIRKGKIFIGHVGDSGIVLGYQEKDLLWKSKALTRDHKPECGVEMTRIQESGGKVISKSGVPRVVWNRPRLGHKGPVRRSTHIDEIPFLAVARSLGDLWSYNSELNTFVVSPEPDVKVVKIDVKSHRCLIFGTDGLWNMLTPQAAVTVVQAAESNNEKHLIASQQTGNGQGDVQMWINPSKRLVDYALDKWSSMRLRADNISVVTLMLDPPGPTHSEILLSQKREQVATNQVTPELEPESVETSVLPNESVQCSYLSSLQKPLPDPVVYPFSINPTCTEPPSYSDAQKQPDSSNNHKDESIASLLEPQSSSDDDDKISAIPIKDESSCRVPLDAVPHVEESIQVAEISSSDTSDEIADKMPNKVLTLATDASIVESSSNLCPEEVLLKNDNFEEMITDTNFALERENWLQQVPKAEKYSEEVDSIDSVDLQAIRFTEPQGPRLRRSANESNIGNKNSNNSSNNISDNSIKSSNTSNISSNNSSNAIRKRITTSSYNNVVMRQPNRRRHSTGAATNPKVEQQHNRLRWHVADAAISRTNGILNSSTGGVQERRMSSPNSFKRRNLEKKVTPVKKIRRPSINRSTSRIQMRENFWDQGRGNRTGGSCSGSRRKTVVGLISSMADSVTSSSSTSTVTPKRWLRSDTVAATPIKTLRSRNIDIAVPQLALQYGSIKSNRILTSQAKLKHSPNVTILGNPSTSPTSVVTKLKLGNCTSTPSSTATPIRTKQGCSVTPVLGSSSSCISSGSSSTSSNSISKRAKIPYNPSARSFTTRSRIKRFSK